MNICIQHHELGTAAVFTLSGRLTLEGSAGAVHDAVERALSSGHKAIFLDVHDVSYMDSAGLGELISSYTLGQSIGVTVRVQNATPRIAELLRITQLGDVLLA